MYIAVMKNQDKPLIVDFGSTVESMESYNATYHDAVEVFPTWPTSHTTFRTTEYALEKAWLWDSNQNRFVQPPTHLGKVTRTEMLALSNISVGTKVFCTTYLREFWWTGRTWQCDQTFEGYNNSGYTATEGDVLVPSSAVNDAYVYTSTMYHPSVSGVVVIGGAQGSWITIADRGIWKVWVYSTVTIGEHLVTHTTGGAAYGVGGPPASVSGQFATTKESKSGTGLDLVKSQIGIMAHY